MKLENRLEYLKAKKRVSSRKKPFYKKWWGFLLIIFIYFIAVFVVATILFISKLIFYPDFRDAYVFSGFNSANEKQEVVDFESFLKLRSMVVEGSESPYLGKADAKIVIVVFSDFNCPYCKKAAEVVASLSVKYGQKIKIISREFPVLSDDSIFLANAALCANDQGKYWPMYYKFFELQGQPFINDLSKLARSVGISDIDKFSNCVNSNENYNFIVQTTVDAQFLELRGTPAWFINGEKIHEGSIDFGTFSEILDKIFSEHDI